MYADELSTEKAKGTLENSLAHGVGNAIPEVEAKYSQDIQCIKIHRISVRLIPVKCWTFSFLQSKNERDF